MKKLTNTEAELKKCVAYWKERVINFYFSLIYQNASGFPMVVGRIEVK